MLFQYFSRRSLTFFLFSFWYFLSFLNLNDDLFAKSNKIKSKKRPYMSDYKNYKPILVHFDFDENQKTKKKLNATKLIKRFQKKIFTKSNKIESKKGLYTRDYKNYKPILVHFDFNENQKTKKKLNATKLIKRFQKKIFTKSNKIESKKGLYTRDYKNYKPILVHFDFDENQKTKKKLNATKLIKRFQKKIFA